MPAWLLIAIPIQRTAVITTAQFAPTEAATRSLIRIIASGAGHNTAAH